MGESWYLAADFQLFLFGPWFMMLIWSFENISNTFIKEVYFRMKIQNVEDLL
jgi:hypothetical protein